MREIVTTSQFKRDVKRVGKRGDDMTKLRELLLLLAAGGPLPPHYRDHPLGGNWNHHRNSYIEPDWLLLYKIEGDDLYLVRIGSHADIMG